MTHAIHRSRMSLLLVTLLIGALTALGLSSALAESPPNPPSRFVGTVKVNGAPAAAGTTVEAVVGTTTCGTGSVFMAGAEARYVVDSPALDPGANPNCGTDGAVVTFRVAGAQANETGTWKNYQLNPVNLTVGGATVATPTPAGATATPGAASTPLAPTTGGGLLGGNGGSSNIALSLMGLLAVSGGLAALAFSRRKSRS
jgi:hypothetical protein